MCLLSLSLSLEPAILFDHGKSPARWVVQANKKMFLDILNTGS